MPTEVDRPAAIRAGLRALVAERGFHGASMSAVAAQAGVATGTAYVHYDSKDDLVVAAYVEAKRRLGEEAVAAVGEAGSPQELFVQLWRGAHEHLRAHPEDAGFLVQVDASPYHDVAHDAVVAGGDPLTAAVEQRALREHLSDLPDRVLYELALGPAVRLAARDEPLDADQLDAVARACWAAVTSA